MFYIFFAMIFYFVLFKSYNEFSICYQIFLIQLLIQRRQRYIPEDIKLKIHITLILKQLEAYEFI